MELSFLVVVVVRLILFPLYACVECVLLYVLLINNVVVVLLQLLRFFFVFVGSKTA